MTLDEVYERLSDYYSGPDDSRYLHYVLHTPVREEVKQVLEVLDVRGYEFPTRIVDTGTQVYIRWDACEVDWLGTLPDFVRRMSSYQERLRKQLPTVAQELLAETSWTTQVLNSAKEVIRAWVRRPDHVMDESSLAELATFAEGDRPEIIIGVVQELTLDLISHLKRQPDLLYQVSSRQFEELIAELLARHRWDVKLTAASKDGGYDIFGVVHDVSGIESAWIIECKRYARENKVGVDIVRALFGVMDDLKVPNGMIATTSHFTRGVHQYKASRYDLELRDYEGVLEWINDYKPNPNGRLYIRDNRLVLPGE